MQVSLSSGNYNIIDSQQVFLFGEDKDLKIDIIADDGFTLSVVLKFVKDESGEQKIKREISGSTMTLTCINFRDQGTGFKAPVRITKMEGKELFLMFWSYLEGDERGKVRSVKYSIFIDK